MHYIQAPIPTLLVPRHQHMLQVVGSPPSEEESCSWIQYFHKKENTKWSLEEKTFKLDEDDIISEISKPIKLLVGRHRVEYDFGAIN